MRTPLFRIGAGWQAEPAADAAADQIPLRLAGEPLTSTKSPERVVG
jgi:hypothetical protein